MAPIGHNHKSNRMGGKDRMKEAKNVIVGFGKAGKTLAFKLAAKGESVILLEKSDQMYGGRFTNGNSYYWRSPVC